MVCLVVVVRVVVLVMADVAKCCFSLSGRSSSFTDIKW